MHMAGRVAEKVVVLVNGGAVEEYACSGSRGERLGKALEPIHDSNEDVLMPSEVLPQSRMLVTVR